MDLNKALNILLIYITFCIYGCGIYTFSGSTLPSHIKTVAIPLFEDKTVEFGIDQQITDIIIDAITQDNTLKISGNRGADSILKGKIVRIDDRSGQYDKNEVASDFRIYITIDVSFEDVIKRKTLWKETWTEFGTYNDNRNDGIEEAIEKLSTNIINRTVSGW
jgi:hypothetical protein